MGRAAVRNGRDNRKMFALLTVSAVSLAAIISWFVQTRGEGQYPVLETGSYVGRINGLDAAREERSLYVEKLPNSDALLVIAFIPDFRPQTIRMVRSADDSKSYRPLPLTVGEQRFELHGYLDGSAVSGFVRSGVEQVGSWTLRKASRATLEGDSAVDKNMLGKLLERRYTVRVLKNEVKESEGRLSALKAREVKLRDFLGDEALLKTRATERREELSQQLATAIEERKREAGEVKTLATELDLIGRISKTGQAVDLARRVAGRENRWYQANWQASEDASGLEEQMGADSNINFAKLDLAVKQAREIQRLLSEIADQKKKIEQLRQAPASDQSIPVEQPVVHPPIEKAPTREEPENSEKNLWNRLFG
jgi:hypothetical protein